MCLILYFSGTQYDLGQDLTEKRPRGKCPQCLYYQRQENAINKSHGEIILWLMVEVFRSVSISAQRQASILGTEL